MLVSPTYGKKSTTDTLVLSSSRLLTRLSLYSNFPPDGVVIPSFDHAKSPTFRIYLNADISRAFVTLMDA